MASPIITDLQNDIIDLLESSQSQLRMERIWLGGGAGENGGEGARPGGFIGQLIQTIVAYDTTEAELITTSGVPSLLDNLNHIRYRLKLIETTGTHVHGIARWTIASGVSQVELPDYAYQIESLTSNGLTIDPLDYTLENFTTIVFDTPVSVSSVVVAQYIIVSE